MVEQNKLSVEVANKTLEQQQQREREARLHQIIDALALRILNLAQFSTIWVGHDWTELFGSSSHLREQALSGRDAVISYALRGIADSLNWVRKTQAARPGKPVRASPVPAKEVKLLLDQFDRIHEILEREPELETVKARAYALDLAAYVGALHDVLSVLAQVEPLN